jgi:hypothetical protein
MGHTAGWNLIRVCALGAALFLAPPVHAQGVGASAHAGTLGLGADVAVSVSDELSLRAGANFFPFDINFDESDVDYDLDLPSPQFLLLADFYPIGGFHVSGGIMVSTSDFDLTAELSEPVEIGETTYTPAEIGNLTGRLATRDVSPYVGIGFGNAAASRIGFVFDLGVAFHGEPRVSATADGPVASLPGFQQDLDAEIAEIQEDVENIIVYPVLSLGISIGLRR